jgi:predicted TIM-barrel fold metal-dependent hydrolase
MMPNEPCTEFDYDDPAFDPLWEAAVALEMPLSFHILTSPRDWSAIDGRARRGKASLNFQHALIRANQDVISMLIWGRVFERFPRLKVVCVEADAGWAPHFMYRMDHFYHRKRVWRETEELQKLPSEYFMENVYLTFQDDFIAFRTTELMNERRLMWANDFPHADSTWPWSQQLIATQTEHLSDAQKRRILRDNVVELYDLPEPAEDAASFATAR